MNKINKNDRTKITKLFKEAFEPYITKIEKREILIPKNKQPLTIVDTNGPNDIYPIYSSENIAYTSLSTYPFKDGKKIGTPICDRGKAAFYEDMAIVIMADGCGLGNCVFNAAQSCVNCLLRYIIDHMEECKTTKQLAEVMVAAACESHIAILTETSDSFQIGTTTILATVFVYTTSNQPIVISLSVGDCHSYRYNTQKMETQQLIGDLRKSVRDVNDCGGRLGPQIERKYPDLRNAIIKVDDCSNGDIVFVATDGFHDNFDPSLLDYQPSDVGFDVKTWKEAMELSNYHECKKLWIEKFISSFFKSSYSLCDVVLQMSEYVVQTTQASRTFMETRKEKLPVDHHLYPGKCDHTTMIMFTIGKRNDMFDYMNGLIPSYMSYLFGGRQIDKSNSLFKQGRNGIQAQSQMCLIDSEQNEFSIPITPASSDMIQRNGLQNQETSPVRIKYNSDNNVSSRHQISNTSCRQLKTRRDDDE